MNNIKYFHISANEIIDETKNFINRSINNHNRLIELEVNIDNYNNFFSILADDITEYVTFHSLCNFLQFVSPDINIQKQCFKADLMLTNYINELNNREDIYKKIKSFYNYFKKNCIINNDDKIFLEKLLKDYEKNGITLEKSKRKVSLKLKQEILELENKILQFYNNNENQVIGLHKEELNDLPDNFKNTLPVINNQSFLYGMTLNKENFNLCMKYIKKENIRKGIELYYSTSCFQIVEPIVKLIILRDNYAKLLGYKNYSDFKNNDSMAQNSYNIKSFLINLLEKLDCKYSKEMETLVKLKSYDFQTQSNINSWDIQYYINNWKKEYGLDEQSVREYFPLSHVLQSIIRIYEDIFNIKFIKMIDKFVWHKSVLTYGVYENNQQLIGYIYLDLFMRKNKYNQIRCFCIQTACIYPYSLGKYTIPIVAIVAYFNKKDPLLYFSDVKSLFHEFTHALQHIFGRTKYCLFTGAFVQHDFVEIPSNVIENLCWNRLILKRLSQHYKTKQALPDNIINKMGKIRDLCIGMYYKKCILTSLYDQLIHSSESFVNICKNIISNKNNNNNNELNKLLISILTDLYKELHQKVLCSISNKSDIYKVGINDNIMFLSDWINIFYSNNAQYYSYIWSKVFSADIINEKCKIDIINNKNFGLEFKNNLLKMTGNIPATLLIKNYLGRDLSINGFLELYNLNNDVEYSFFFNSEYFTTKNENNKNNQNNKEKYETVDEESNYSNRFTEIYSYDLEKINDNNYRDIKMIQEKLKRLDNNYKKSGDYNNIFIKDLRFD